MTRPAGQDSRRRWVERSALVLLLVGVAGGVGLWQRSWSLFLVVFAVLGIYALAELAHWLLVARLVGQE